MKLLYISLAKILNKFVLEMIYYKKPVDKYIDMKADTKKKKN
jgi:hypothetical protein